MLPTFAIYQRRLASDVPTFEVRILSSNGLRLGRRQRWEEVQNVLTEGSIRRYPRTDEYCPLMRVCNSEKCPLD